MNKPERKTLFTSERILQTLEYHKVDLQRMRVRKIGLFGSYRRGTPSTTSDMDFLVSLEQPSFDNYMDVKFFLEDLFGCSVDLVMEETLKPRLRPYVMGEVLYAQGL